MKYLILLMVITWGTVYQARSQNKVENPSFELFVNCPQVVGAPVDPPGPSTTVNNWYKAGLGSTDFYNACSTGQTDVPANVKGWQQPRTGQGYGGFYAILEANLAAREYMQCALLSPLQAGHHYKVSFWVSLADSTANGLKASDEVAAYFSNAFMVVATAQISTVTPQIKQEAGNFLTNTTGWTEVTDTFIASGTETHMIIGVFSPFASQSYQVINGPLDFYQVYYYLDDVCVLDLDETSLIAVFDTAVCDGVSNITLTARPGMTSYQWNNGATTQQSIVTTSGSYWVKSFGECEMRIDTFHVGLFADSGDVDLGNDTSVCFNTSLTLNAYRPGITSYVWSTGANTPQINVTHSGTYSVRVESACGVFADTIMITVKDEVPLLPSLDTVICTMQGLLDIPLNGTNIKWYDDIGEMIYHEQPQMDLSKPRTYLYWITQTIDGCESEASKVQVVVLTRPYPVLRDTTICDGKKVWLGTPVDNTTYLWSNGSDSCCIPADHSGIYHLTLSNICGTTYDSARVAVLEHCENCIWMPTAFSPNNDGLNDVFDVKSVCPMKRFLLRVYNRFGQLVFTSANVSNAWDGTFHNTYCDVGVYYYYLEATPEVGDRKKITRKGEVTLMR